MTQFEDAWTSNSEASLAEAIEIWNLMSQIALSTDERNWESFLSCFVSEALADYGSVGVGPIVEVVEGIRESQEAYNGTMNLVATHRSTIEGERASAETYVVSHHFREQDGSSCDDQAGTYYADEFVRLNGEWKISRRVAQLRWFRSDVLEGGWL